MSERFDRFKDIRADRSHDVVFCFREDRLQRCFVAPDEGLERIRLELLEPGGGGLSIADEPAVHEIDRGPPEAFDGFRVLPRLTGEARHRCCGVAAAKDGSDLP